MHSCPIMVESMSARKSFLRRAITGCTTISMGRSSRAARRRSAVAAISSLPSPKGMSAATSSNSHRAGPEKGRIARAPSSTVLSSAGLAGLQISVATRDMNSKGHNDTAVLIAGPTASGKSALALALARKTGGVVINTDSMQVYRDLRIITARPTPEEEAVVPHRLYGHVDAARNFSAGSWVTDAAAVLEEARAQRALPIFVGG